MENNPDLSERIERLDYGETDPEAIIIDHKDKMAADFPALNEVDYSIKYVPEVLADYMAPAFYLIPPIDATTDNTIYINNKRLGVEERYTTLAHEGYPGHLYQGNYNLGRVSPLRYTIDFNGYSEGWGFYVEQFSYDWTEYAQNDPACADYFKLDNRFGIAVMSRIDIGIHYEDWTIAKTREYLLNYVEFSEEETRDLYRDIAQNPGGYLRYFAPYLKFMELLDKAQEEMGEDFVLKEFHRAILDVGPSYFDEVERAVDRYIATAD
jgi:uncharacterized protein (DUF885 family)